jgi:signal transduction histidine kinase
VIGLLVAYQLGVTLLAPTWADAVTGWFRAALAWPEVFLLLWLSLWLTRTRRPQARTWWLLSVAMLGYALGKTVLVVSAQVAFPSQVPFPWWSDLCYLLTFPCFFLAPVLWPGVPADHRSGLARTKLMLDTCLVMGAATGLSWYFLLAPIFLGSTLPWPGKAVTLAYPIGDLGGMFALTVMFLRAGRRHGQRSILQVLVVVALCLILADSWMAWLHLSARSTLDRLPDLVFLLASLLLPLAGLTQYRALQREPVKLAGQVEVRAGARRPTHDLLESLRFLSPFAAVLLACVSIEARILIAPLPAVGVLVPHLVMLALLLLVLGRQGVAYLEQGRLRDEREAARAKEQALCEATRQMETFLGLASHELRTPLTSISLHQQLMWRRLQRLKPQEAQSPPDVVRALHAFEAHLRGAEEQLQRQGRFISELLDVSRLRCGHLELHVDLADLWAIVRAAVEEQRRVWPERAILLCLPAEERVPIAADAVRIGQVVMQYLTNALRYSGEDLPVETGVQVAAQRAEVWVRDQGPGLAPGEQARIWECFHRAPGVQVQSGSGVGLGIGLYLSKMIIERHGGQVGVRSAGGAGATFWFTLPLARARQGGIAGDDRGPHSILDQRSPLP